jgi:hypothetical protein
MVPRVETLSFIHKSEKGQIFGKHRFWSEWIQAGSLCYFTPSRVATGPWRCFPA